MRRRLMPLLLAAGLSSGPAIAADPDSAEAVVARATEVARAHRAGDRKALARFASRTDVDPWLVSDRLVALDEPGALDAYLLELSGRDAEALRAHARRPGARGPSAEERAALDDAAKNLAAGRVELAWTVLDGLTLPEDSVPHVEASRLLGKAAVARGGVGDGERAARAFSAGATAAAAIGWTQAACDLYRMSAAERRRAGDLVGAREALRGFLRESERGGRTRGLASALNQLAAVEADLGDFAASLADFGRAASLLRGPKQIRQRSSVEHNAAVVHRRLGQFAQAIEREEHALSALGVASDPEDVVLAAEILVGIGAVLNESGRHDEAVAKFEEAISRLRALPAEGSPEDAGVVLGMAAGNLGAAHAYLGDYDAAEEATNQALEFFESRKDGVRIAHALGNLADISATRGQAKKAVVYQTAVVKRLGDGGNVSLRLAARGALAHMRMLAGEVERAAAEHLSVLNEARALGLLAVEVGQRGGLAQAHYALGKDVDAVRFAREAFESSWKVVGGLSDAHGAAAREHLADALAAGLAAAIRRGQPADVHVMLEVGRGALLARALGGLDAVWAHVLPRELAEAQAAAQARENAALAAWVVSLSTGRGDANLRRLLDEARTARQEVLDRIEREERAVASLGGPVASSLDAARKDLAPGDVFVAFGLSSPKSVALIVSGSEARIVPLPEEKEIETACKEMFEEGGSPRGAAAADALRAKVIAPLGLLPSSRVIVSPDAALTYVPFSMLLPGRAIALTPSAAVHGLLRKRPPSRSSAVLALGDPLYDKEADTPAAAWMRKVLRLQPLPASGDEARAVGTDVRVRERASEEELRLALYEHRDGLRSLHLACHGIVDRHFPLRSSLALTPTGSDDGLLNVQEILQLRIPADLVVLSACDSSKGPYARGEGLTGFVRSFMLAGAPRVIASLWKVDDRATKELMVKLYELWKPKQGAGLPVAEALRRAQEHVRAKPGWEHPRYWAGWVLWGAPD